MKPEEKFHRARRMFAIVDNTLHFAPANDPRGHIEWLIEEGLLPGETWDDFNLAFAGILRGYYHPENGLVFYQGQDFAVPPVEDLKIVGSFIGPIADALGLPGETSVWLGARRGEVGDTWVGRLIYGRVADLIVLPKTMET